MKNITLKQQFTLAFGALAVLVLVVSLLALRSLSQANQRFSAHVYEVARRTALATEMSDAVNARAVAARNLVLVSTPAERELEQARVEKAHEQVNTALKKLQEAVAPGTGAPEQDRTLVARIAEVETRYGPVALAIVQLALEGRRDEAIEKMNTECRPLLAALLKVEGDYLQHSRQQAEQSVAHSRDDYAAQRATLILASLLALATAITLGLLIPRRLVRALGAEPAALSRAAQRVAEGDLRPVQGADAAPASSVLASMGAMQRQLVGLIGQVRSSADSIATASTQIAQGNNDLSGRTEQQASALQETAASMEQLGTTVRQNAHHAQQANTLAQGASNVATQGGAVVDRVVRTMRDINDSSRRIADIIGVIDGIAFQTNILALNAAVEAARAGEQGRGFAVVAAEVRTLAQRSAEAAREIKSLITASVERVEQGTALADEAGATMNQIVEAIVRVSDIMGEISTASVEQSTGVAQVAEAVGQMDRTTQQNAALVEESAAAAESLRWQAQQLVQGVAVFKLAA